MVDNCEEVRGRSINGSPDKQEEEEEGVTREIEGGREKYLGDRSETQ